MAIQRLLYYIGAFIFSGLTILSFIQIKYMDERPAAWLFIAVSAIIYFALVTLYPRNQKAFVIITAVLAVVSMIGVFSVDHLFQGGH